MNHLRHVSHLRNNYSGMRHGQSKANVKNVIVSCIDNDRPGNYGLTDLGRQQALMAAGSALSSDTVICSSGFARAVQTARIVCTALGAADVMVTEALRERCFGDWEGMACENYATVWAADKASPDHAESHVEPASAVLARATAFIITLEQRYSGRDILLVSHGDTLQILQTGFLRMNPGQHRDLPHLEPAEIRRFHLGLCLTAGHGAGPGDLSGMAGASQGSGRPACQAVGRPARPKPPAAQRDRNLSPAPPVAGSAAGGCRWGRGRRRRGRRRAGRRALGGSPSRRRAATRRSCPGRRPG
jgi:broad specificity phosphatase PhoE